MHSTYSSPNQKNQSQYGSEASFSQKSTFMRVFDVLVRVGIIKPERQGVERETGRVGNSRERGEGILKKKRPSIFSLSRFSPYFPSLPRPTFLALLQ